MKTKKINGMHLEKMIRNGLANLGRHVDELNSLNVFPVADGDTGTNMYTTLESGIIAANSNKAAGAYLKAVTDAMLFGARGNSGVILSQLFRGMFIALSRSGGFGPREMKAALIMAYKSAYAAVVRPVEGTILTVAREGIEYIKNQVDRDVGFEELFSMYIAEMRKSLAHTPEILPALKEANVVDSGALGYIYVIEGMQMYLFGDNIKEHQLKIEAKPQNDDNELNHALFNENTIFDSGYCMEFVLQLMKDKKYSQRFNLNRYIDGLQDFGNSIVAVQDSRRVKVHIHTFKPGRIFTYSQEYGEFVTCKVENMQLQHNNMVIQKKLTDETRIPFAVIAVVDQEPAGRIFEELGCNLSITGGTNMNVSVQEIIDAVKSVNAEKVVILPNNGDLIHTANQAKDLYNESEIIIIETHNIPEGYCAMQMDIADSKDYSFRVKQMQQGMDNVAAISVTSSSRDLKIDDMDCPTGTLICVSSDKVLCRGDDSLDAFCNGIDILMNEEEKETCLIFRGEAEADDSENELLSRLNEKYPLLDVVFLYGGSKLYNFTAALM